MKKKHFLSAFLPLLGLAVMISSCDDFLDEQPFSQTSDEQFWQTAGHAESGVAAIYDAMQETYRIKYWLWGDFRSDNFIASDRVSVANEEIVTNTLTPTNGNALRWDNLYQMIGRANLAIQKIPDISTADPNLLAEAYATRAFAYFDAVRVWGDVPLFTEPILGLDQELLRPRTSATEIMNNVIIPDMLEAERLMVEPSNPFRFSKASVWALQADVYMFLQDYAKANEALDKIIDLGTYELVDNRDAWLRLFLNDPLLGSFQEGPELIFSIRYDLLEDGNRASGNYELFFAGIPSFFISPNLENKWIERFPIDSSAWVAQYPDFAPQTVDEEGFTVFGDWRYFESREEGRAIGEARPAKYTKLNFSANDDDTNIPIYRYSHVLLQKALAENRLNNPEGAVALVNQIRDARQLPNISAADFTDVDELENYILDERQFELFGEGHRWWDLRAAGKAVEVMDTINNMTEETLLFPIFQVHLIDNPMLTQNPGY